MMEGLFDIGKANIEELIHQSINMQRNKESIMEDLSFSEDHGNERIQFISHIRDKELEARIEMRMERYIRYEEYRKKMVANGACEPKWKMKKILVHALRSVSVFQLIMVWKCYV